MSSKTSSPETASFFLIKFFSSIIPFINTLIKYGVPFSLNVTNSNIKVIGIEVNKITKINRENYYHICGYFKIDLYGSQCY